MQLGGLTTAQSTLREKCQNTEFFLVSVSLRIEFDCGKYEPEETRYWDTFHAVQTL